MLFSPCPVPPIVFPSINNPLPQHHIFLHNIYPWISFNLVIMNIYLFKNVTKDIFLLLL